MNPDPDQLRLHADAVDTLLADTTSRLNELINAQGVMVQYPRSPMREMVLQSLQKSILKIEAVNGSLPSYSRTLRLYILEMERSAT